MGLAIIVNDADFSGIAVGTLPFNPGVSGMTHAYETRVSPEHALVNRVSGLVDADIIGAPMFSATSMEVSVINSMLFGFNMEGYETVFVIYKVPVFPSANMIIVGTFQEPTTRGAAYLMHRSDGELRHESTKFVGGDFAGNAGVFLPPPDAERAEMIALTTEDGVGIGMSRPRTSDTSKEAVLAPDSLIKPIPTRCRTRPNAGPNAEIFGVMRFNRPLSDAEITTVYKAAKRRWGAIGVEI